MVMLGKYAADSSSYIAKAGDSYKYFDLGSDGWSAASKAVNNNMDEMWRVNKKFLDNCFEAGDDIFFSHNPWEATGYFEKEVLHLIDKGATDFVEVSEGLWKMIKN